MSQQSRFIIRETATKRRATQAIYDTVEQAQQALRQLLTEAPGKAPTVALEAVPYLED